MLLLKWLCKIYQSIKLLHGTLFLWKAIGVKEILNMVISLGNADQTKLNWNVIARCLRAFNIPSSETFSELIGSQTLIDQDNGFQNIVKTSWFYIKMVIRWKKNIKCWSITFIFSIVYNSPSFSFPLTLLIWCGICHTRELIIPVFLGLRSFLGLFLSKLWQPHANLDGWSSSLPQKHLDLYSNSTFIIVSWLWEKHKLITCNLHLWN